ncbi:MAG: hypothetical protein AVDCRST_MAG22-2843, partial [uncultured Rubrobacteraceae bacterium]
VEPYTLERPRGLRGGHPLRPVHVLPPCQRGSGHAHRNLDAGPRDVARRDPADPAWPGWTARPAGPAERAAESDGVPHSLLRHGSPFGGHVGRDFYLSHLGPQGAGAVRGTAGFFHGGHPVGIPALCIGLRIAWHRHRTERDTSALGWLAPRRWCPTVCRGSSHGTDCCHHWRGALRRRVEVAGLCPPREPKQRERANGACQV